MNMRPQQPIMGPSIGARMLFQVDMESKLTEILAQMREIGAKMTYLEKRIAGIEEPKPKEAFVEIKAAAVHHSEHHGHESFHHRMERYAGNPSVLPCVYPPKHTAFSTQILCDINWPKGLQPSRGYTRL